MYPDVYVYVYMYPVRTQRVYMYRPTNCRLMQTDTQSTSYMYPVYMYPGWTGLKGCCLP